MRVKGRVLPDSFRWITCSTVCGGRYYSYYVEAIAHRFEWFVCKQCLHCCLGIVDECLHLFVFISFGDISNMDTTCRIGRLLKCDIWSDVFFANMSDEDVGRIDLMTE